MIGALFALAVLAQPATAAEPDYAIPDLTVADGDRWTVTVERSFEQTSGGSTKRWAGRASYAVELDRTMDRGNVVTWTPINAELQADAPAEMLVLAARAPVVFTADMSLAPKRIENWDALKSAAVKASPLATAFSSATPEAAARFLLREAELLSVLQNMPLERGKPYEVDDNPPNPLGGPPLAAKLRFEPAQVSNGVIRVRSNRTLAPESLKRVLDQLKAALAKLGPKEKAEAEAQLSGLSLDRRDDCTFELDVVSGQTRTADCVVSVRSADGLATRTEKIRVTQTPKP